MNDPDEKILWEAEFNPKVKTYWLISAVLTSFLTIVLIPFLPLIIPIAWLIADKYLASHRCTLTERTLKVGRGILVRQEKTVPLDRITDLGLVQGPIMRALELEAVSVETAGQSGPGSLVRLTGIREGRAFRDAVLKQRDLVSGSETRRGESPVATPPSLDANSHETLVEIRDILRRMEERSQTL
ncbi:PH domain-containing protein [Rhodopirellula sp. JC740]|uniref:PH domain-containing protein n=1 Tax=Rhodopirellula halodulae TaxID=2894198 RepID=A0ABS8NCJ5_9BACT|nr:MULTISPECIES: PH domain-containing protein [unclassified Rhodopirellula]MCC9641265.1 PH domain-containing protein [Rhodopirellula sp. JC740]MCC9657673.1 PH domain-containing protein [Rhodopirellula sp. JC737]